MGLVEVPNRMLYTLRLGGHGMRPWPGIGSAHGVVSVERSGSRTDLGALLGFACNVSGTSGSTEPGCKLRPSPSSVIAHRP